MSESLCLGRLINHPSKLSFSSPVGAKVVKHGPYTLFKLKVPRNSMKNATIIIIAFVRTLRSDLLK